MKTKLFLLAMATMALAGCTDDLERRSSYSPEGGLQATIPTYPFDDGTRVNISNDLQTFTWSNGDQIGIYYLDGDITAHAGFGILSGGGTTGTFTNSAFSLHPSSTYYGFFPFNESATVSEAPVDFTGQRQIESGSAAHLGTKNYMYSVVNTDGEGNAQIQFHNLGSVMVIRLKAPATEKYSSLEIRSNNANFTTKGNASMTDGTVTPTETSNSIRLSLGFIGDGLSMTQGDLLTFYLLTAPVDLSGSTLYFVLHRPKEGSMQPLPFANMTGKDMKAGRAYLYDLTNREAPYVTFGGSGEQTLQLSKEVPSLEYSVNGGAWTTLGTNTVTFGGTNGNLRLRGKSSVGTNGATISFGNSTPVACSGDIRTLVDYENYETTNTGSAKFNSLFSNCSALVTAPELPATTLADSCYYYMFRGCSSLTQAPALPATTLAKSCYQGMFHTCSSLTTAPELPATTLANDCYTSMFYYCTALAEAPELPATALAEDCYWSMFNGCSSLTEAPALPATVMVLNCYRNMFYRCSSLTSAPELPAITLAEACYNAMFKNCTSLTTAPDLPATTLAVGCYSNMFAGCSNLNYVKMMAPDISGFACVNNWLDNVSSTGTFVKNAAAIWDNTGVVPAGWTVQTADGTPYVTFTAQAVQTLQMSQAVSSLEYSVNGGAWTTLGTRNVTFGGTRGKLRLRGKSSVGTNSAGIFFGYTTPVACSGDIRTLVDYENYDTANTSQAVFAQLFSNCSQLTTAPDLPATTLAESCYRDMFRNCSSLVQAPKLPATTLQSGCYYFMFFGCTSLATAPELPATTLADQCYFGMFMRCTSLTQAPELPTTNLSNSCYKQMFTECTSLTTAPELPATTLQSGCYAYMFYNCTSLTTAPELPATTLTPSCYMYMFNGCSSLNYINMMATDISATSCLSYWVADVSSTGTFVKNAAATWETYGTSGIPEGWAVALKND